MEILKMLIHVNYFKKMVILYHILCMVQNITISNTKSKTEKFC